jgi:hypothetical protein
MPPKNRIGPRMIAVLLALVVSSHAHAQSPRPIEFNRDVRPILSDACFHCHGPDKAKRKAKLGLDNEDDARRTFVPGKPEESELIQRITANDKTKRMPPPSAPVALTTKQIDALKQWIKEGAKWQKHWAFLPPARPALPEVKNKAWPIKPIDYFVLARLEQEGMTPSPEADPVTLIRRMSFDLTGLPPTPAEVDEFVKAWEAASAKQKRQAVVEELADRLLASPRYGERMAQRWLDGARYADTNGYQNDGERVMWRWRDWVIEAFNDNMPFDRFTIEQLAGDLLPNPTLEQRIATGFNRNHRGNSEGGVIPEEFAVEYVVDRVDTTATVWLGLTAGCARCHNHKYDPISQKEFYQLYAYFNNVPERGKAIKYGNSPPYIKAPTKQQAARLQSLQARLKDAEKAWEALKPTIVHEQHNWEKGLALDSEVVGAHLRGDATHFCLVDNNPRDPKVTMHRGAAMLRFPPGDDIQQPDAKYVDLGFFDKFTMGAWIVPSEQGGPILSRMADTDRAEGYQFALIDGKLHVQLVKRWLDDAIRVETEEKVAPNRLHFVAFSYDGSRLASGIKVYIDGRPAKLRVNLDDLNQSFATKEPFRIGQGGGKKFRGSIGWINLFRRVLSDDEASALAVRETLGEVARIPAARRSPGQAAKIDWHFLLLEAGTEIQAALKPLEKSRTELAAFDATIPTSMVMEETSPPRDAFILLRGEYDKKGPKVTRNVPAAFPPLPKDAPNNRLGFAQWLVAPENPLTARVAVNRHWQMLFGTGIVKTVEDFGAQGDWPSHPELLDWLAMEFMSGLAATRSGARDEERALLCVAAKQWDTKRLLKLIVTSATYRQSSRVTPALLQKDPDNRLLARGPRFRLSADMIRDQALFASGLLVEQLGGPSVRPYQPTGLAKELTGTEDYVQDHGLSLYRRSLYTFWKRTIAPPTLMNFDAANRETCVVRETRTNTPLQALNLMNDVTFVEAARVLAERVMKTEKTAGPRLAFAWRLATARPPSQNELKILRTAFERHHAHFSADRAAALKLIGAGEAPRDQQLDSAEHAAYAAVCNLILNLDEVITKE